MSDTDPGASKLTLLGGFALTVGGHPIELPHSAERLVALVALHPEAVHRAAAMTRLWPDSPPKRAAASLRTALWQVRRRSAIPILEADQGRLRLSPLIEVDVHQQTKRARAMLPTGTPPSTADVEGVAGITEAVAALSSELLPSWPDDWLLAAAERWNQVRLHALEAVSYQLLELGEYLPAIETALAAVALEPFRETAHRLLIEVHQAEGNTASAVRHYHRYRALLADELGVVPSDRMTRLVSAITGASAQAGHR